MKTDKKIFIAFILNLSFTIFEIIGGILTNSVAILSDAIHDLGDAISIGVSYFLEKKSRNKPDNIYTYGYSRYSVLGAFITASILVVGSSLVIYNSIVRLFNPIALNYDGMILFAVFGLIVNFLAVYFTKGGENLNQKTVNLHMLEDVFGWLVVLIGAIIMKYTDVIILDSIMSIILSIFILFGTFKNLKEILDLFLEKTPKNISIEDIKGHLLKIDGVLDVHHIHIWSIDGINNFATLHIISKNKDICKVKNKIKEEMQEYGISHTTIEVDRELNECSDLECVPKIVAQSHHHHHN